MADHWVELAKANLLPLSRERANLNEALKEWQYTRQSVVVEKASCELCEQTDLHYQFEIQNRFTTNVLWIGSTCITRFEISVLEEGRLLQGPAASRAVASDRKALIEGAKVDRAVNALVALAHAAPDFKFDSFLRSFRVDGHISPLQAKVILWQAKEKNLGENVNIADFKIGLKSKRDQEGMFSLKGWQRRQLAPALTRQQQKWCTDHIGPNWKD